MTVALMYHALYEGHSLATIDAEDRPYAIDLDTFRRQLDLLEASGRVGIPMPGTPLPDYIITFDDGHLSNAELALPELVARGLPAVFFITTGFTGKRAHFCGSDELAALADAGMTIGSHGVTHRFFDDMTPGEARSELADSRAFLEAATGRECRSLSFPGGRFTAATLRLLPETGYHQWYGSATGLIDERHFVDRSSETVTPELTLPATGTLPLQVVSPENATPKNGTVPLQAAPLQALSPENAMRESAMEEAVMTKSAMREVTMTQAEPSDGVAGNDRLRWQRLEPLPRSAIRASTSEEEFRRMVEPDLAWYRRQQRVAAVKGGVRRLLGNRLYHALYRMAAR
ncbi:MAG: hypothetical protein CSB44_12290 [Gammaproteobacteria bacterium]|nr:MAG: hypothetical protein CSB44_12290 [Gammaproteobacteria bacterium]